MNTELRSSSNKNQPAIEFLCELVGLPPDTPMYGLMFLEHVSVVMFVNYMVFRCKIFLELQRHLALLPHRLLPLLFIQNFVEMAKMECQEVIKLDSGYSDYESSRCLNLQKYEPSERDDFDDAEESDSDTYSEQGYSSLGNSADVIIEPKERRVHFSFVPILKTKTLSCLCVNYINSFGDAPTHGMKTHKEVRKKKAMTFGGRKRRKSFCI